jgi:hypothetical protein
MEDVLWEAGIDTYYDNAKKTKKMSNTDPIINRG